MIYISPNIDNYKEIIAACQHLFSYPIDYIFKSDDNHYTIGASIDYNDEQLVLVDAHYHAYRNIMVRNKLLSTSSTVVPIKQLPKNYLRANKENT